MWARQKKTWWGWFRGTLSEKCTKILSFLIILLFSSPVFAPFFMYNITQIQTLLVFPFYIKYRRLLHSTNDIKHALMTYRTVPGLHPITSCVSISLCVTSAVVEVVLLHSEIWTSWEVTQKWSWHGIKDTYILIMLQWTLGHQLLWPHGSLLPPVCLSRSMLGNGLSMDLQNVLSNARGSCWNSFISIKTLLLNIFEVSFLCKTDAKLSYINSAAWFTL